MTTNTGGPAFPTQSKISANATNTWIAEAPGSPGMTLRDFFAAKAMQGMMADGRTGDDYVASLAYQYADAMLEARK